MANGKTKNIILPNAKGRDWKLPGGGTFTDARNSRQANEVMKGRGDTKGARYATAADNQRIGFVNKKFDKARRIK